jgi:hypothetical protein
MPEFVLANGTVFPSKGAAKKYFKEVLEAQWSEGLIPKHLESNMRAILRQHIFQDQIIGPGIKHYEVRENESGKCFYAVRVDGTVVPFGVHQAIYPLGYGSRVSSAFRNAVRQDTESFRPAEGETKPCVITGELLDRQEGEVDHQEPWTFECILAVFLSTQGLTVDDVKLAIEPGTSYREWPANPELRNKFRIFHANVAQLRWIKKEINSANSSLYRLRDNPDALSLIEMLG